MNPLHYEALKTIVQIAYEIAVGKRGESNTNDDIKKSKQEN